MSLSRLSMKMAPHRCMRSLKTSVSYSVAHNKDARQTELSNVCSIGDVVDFNMLTILIREIDQTTVSDQSDRVGQNNPQFGSVDFSFFE